MVYVFDVYAQRSELVDESFNFFLMRISSHIAKLSVFSASENEINGPGDAIGNGDFRFVG